MKTQEVTSKIADDGVAVEEHWRLDGKLHRTDGPAIRKWVVDGEEWEEHWYLDGQLHRTNGHASYKYLDDRSTPIYGPDIWEKRWVVKGKLHRTNGPAIVIKDEHEYDEVLEKHWYIDGKLQRSFLYDSKTEVVEEKWYKDDVYHRTTGPAHVRRYDDEHILEENWYSHGKLHRIDGPARRLWDWDNGGWLEFEHWYSHGKLHRTDGGPAYTEWADDVKMCEEAWYVDGLRHRIDRPALMEYRSYESTQELWLQGVKYDCRKKHRQAQLLLSGRQKVMNAARVLTLEAKLPTDILSTIGGFM